MNIYSIKNEKLNFFNRPIYCESSNEAISYIQNVLMSDADRALKGLRSDLALYELGSIDFVSGRIDAYKKPVLISDLAPIFDSIPDEKILVNPDVVKLEDRLCYIEDVLKKLKGETNDC